MPRKYGIEFRLVGLPNAIPAVPTAPAALAPPPQPASKRASKRAPKRRAKPPPKTAKTAHETTAKRKRQAPPDVYILPHRSKVLAYVDRPTESDNYHLFEETREITNDTAAIIYSKRCVSGHKGKCSVTFDPSTSFVDMHHKFELLAVNQPPPKRARRNSDNKENGNPPPPPSSRHLINLFK